MIKAEWKVYHEEIEQRRKKGKKGRKGARPDDVDDDDEAPDERKGKRKFKSAKPV